MGFARAITTDFGLPERSQVDHAHVAVLKRGSGNMSIVAGLMNAGRGMLKVKAMDMGPSNLRAADRHAKNLRTELLGFSNMVQSHLQMDGMARLCATNAIIVFAVTRHIFCSARRAIMLLICGSQMVRAETPDYRNPI
jgi:formamidopyrimidine-DNA glycosylase